MIATLAIAAIAIAVVDDQEADPVLERFRLVRSLEGPVAAYQMLYAAWRDGDRKTAFQNALADRANASGSLDELALQLHELQAALWADGETSVIWLVLPADQDLQVERRGFMEQLFEKIRGPKAGKLPSFDRENVLGFADSKGAPVSKFWINPSSGQGWTNEHPLSKEGWRLERDKPRLAEVQILSWDTNRLLVYTLESNDKTEPGLVFLLPIPKNILKKTVGAPKTSP